MSFEVAKAGLDLLLHKGVREIRFFGGEPLFEFDLIRKIVSYIDGSGLAHKDLHYRITTNGTLLDEEILKTIKSDPRMHLVVSLDGDPASHEKNRLAASVKEAGLSWLENYGQRLSEFSDPVVTVNMVVSPDNAYRMVDNFGFILKKGFKRINLLPAYYVEWTESEIEQLRRGFNKLVILIEGLWGRGIKLEIGNMTTNVEQPLFSGGIFIDSDGEIFSSDMVTLLNFDSSRRQLSLGNVENTDIVPTLTSDDAKIWPQQLKQLISSKAFLSTEKVDAELGKWVESISAIKEKNQFFKC